MADMMDTLKGLLGDNADEKLSGIMQILNPDGAQSEGDDEKKPSNNSVSDTPSITPEMLMMAQIWGALTQSRVQHLRCGLLSLQK